MFSAIHKKTGEEYSAWRIWKPGLFDNKDVHKEEWLCPIDDIENAGEISDDVFVTPVKAHQRNETKIPSFFRLMPGFSDKVILREESEMHKQAKTVICSILTEEFDIKLEYDKDVYPVKDLPIDYEKLFKNTRKLEVRKKNIMTGQYKQADVLLPFIYSPYWGNGIVIEIRHSEGDEKIEDKEDFWFQRGYSIIWMGESNFEKVDGRLGINGDKLQVIPSSIGYNRVMNKREGRMLGFLQSGREDMEVNSALISDFKELCLRTCRTCGHGSVDTRDSDIIACWHHKKRNHNGNFIPTKHERLDTCEEYIN